MDTGGPSEQGPSDQATGVRARVSAERDRVRARVDDSRRRLEASREHSATVDVLFGAMERDTATGGGVLAGAVAFRIFLFLVPFVFVLVTGLGVASDAASQSPEEVAHDLGISGLAARAVSSSANASIATRVTTLVVAAVALFLASRALFKVVFVVHALVWRVGPFRAANVNRAALALIGIVTGIVLVGTVLGRARSISSLLGIAVMIASVAIPFAVWLLVSQHLPHVPAPWWAFAPGAALVALGMLALQIVTVYFIAYEVARKSETYGAIGTSLALLLWAYLLGRLLTSAAVLNASLWARAQRHDGAAAARGAG
jgi:uncharacterized BrkB/YihY/UPF0761 family membrane protein